MGGNGNAVLDWEWVGMGMGMIRWEWKGNWNKKVIPTHLYSRALNWFHSEPASIHRQRSNRRYVGTHKTAITRN